MTNKLSLSSILDKFKGAQNASEKVANDEAPIEEAPVNTAAEAPTESKDTDTNITKEAEAQDEVKDSKTDAEVLKGIAKEAAEVEKTATEKEASEFGKLFAHSFMEELEMEGTVKQASENAYAATVESVQEADFQTKLASVFEEANTRTCLAVIENSAFAATKDAMLKQAAHNFERDFPLALLGATQEAYDTTVEALTNAA